jgi:hypothetical protein
MKKIILLLLVIAGIFEGCKKYEEGPWISLRSAKKRLIGSYSVIQYTVNGIDSLELYNDSMYNRFDIIFDKNTNDFGYGIDGYRSDGKHSSLVGHWEFNDNKTNLIVSSSTCYSGFEPYHYSSGTGPFINNATPEWEIIRLTSKEVKMKTNFNSKEYLINLKR